MLKNILFVLVFTKLVITGDTARILGFYPIPSISHQIVFRSITQELLNKGHELVVITPNPAYSRENRPENLTEINMHDIAYEIWIKGFINVEVMTGKRNEIHDQISLAYEIIVDVIDKQLQSDEVQTLTLNKTQRFDLILVEGVTWLTMALTYIYKVPVILINSLGATAIHLRMFGSPRHPIYHPTFLQQTVYNHSLHTKLAEFLNFYHISSYYGKHDILGNQMLNRLYGQDAPTIENIRNDVDSMLFLNAHNIWEMNRPVSKNVVFMGGIHQTIEKPLSKVIIVFK